MSKSNRENLSIYLEVITLRRFSQDKAQTIPIVFAINLSATKR